MRKIRINRTRPFNSSNRQGTASLELTLFMPTYAAMLMVLFTIFSFARTRGEVAVGTRHEAWMNRAQSGKQTEPLEISSGGAEEVGRILNHEQDPTLGLVTATHQENATIYLKTLNLLTNIQLDHAVMTDTWDFKTIPFEAQKNHPRLNLAERTLVFGSVTRDAFSSLALESLTHLDLARERQESLNESLNQTMSGNAALRRIKRAKAEVQRAVSAVEAKIKSLGNELKKQLNLIPPNQKAIKDLNEKLAAESEELRKLNKKLSDINTSVVQLEKITR